MGIGMCIRVALGLGVTRTCWWNCCIYCILLAQSSESGLAGSHRSRTTESALWYSRRHSISWRSNIMIARRWSAGRRKSYSLAHYSVSFAPFCTIQIVSKSHFLGLLNAPKTTIIDPCVVDLYLEVISWEEESQSGALLREFCTILHHSNCI